MYKVSDFDYNLPPKLIAQEQIKPRDHSRLLLLNKKNGKIMHKHFYDIVDYFQAGDLLVLNNSKVFPARLIGHKAESGGAMEVFLLRKIDSSSWECLLRGRAQKGLKIIFGNNLQAVVEDDRGGGTRVLKFNRLGPALWRIVNKIGEVPLPPYIKREKQKASDVKNYQTVFANDRKLGSVAAPTAGLHFTPSLLKKIKARGVKIVYVTLHVGLGTFAPMKTELISEHKMHSEYAEISSATLKAILNAKKNKARVIPVGTTSCRTIESVVWESIKKKGDIRKQSFWTDIFIYPGYEFKVTDALITNFHLPKSTLLMLVSALAGREKIKSAYQEAIDRKYRFFSYGDSMFIY